MPDDRARRRRRAASAPTAARAAAHVEDAAQRPRQLGHHVGALVLEVAGLGGLLVAAGHRWAPGYGLASASVRPMDADLSNGSGPTSASCRARRTAS